MDTEKKSTALETTAVAATITVASILNFVLVLAGMALTLFMLFMMGSIVLAIVMNPVGLAVIAAGIVWLCCRKGTKS